MRRFLLASTAAVLLTAPAGAADLPVKAPPMVAVAVYSWTGCHLGASGGYGWARSSTTTTIVDPAPTVFADADDAQPFYNANMSPTLRPRGGIFGGQIGCNYQSGRFVLGAETDLSYFRLRETVVTFVDPPLAVPLTSTTEVSTNWLWTGRLRAGFAVDRALFYATGGIAVTRLNYSQSNFFAGCGPTNCTESVAASSTRAGWTVGGGIEFAVANNWTVRGEYLHARFGNLNTRGTVFVGAVPSVPFDHTANLRVNIARVGLNYRWGGPVVARY